MSLDVKIEMSQQRELATGARGGDARSRHKQAGKTPPISLTGQSIKCEIGRVVPADHEAPGQQMQRRLQESEVADVRLVTAERGLALQTKRPLRQSKATEHDRGDTLQTSVWKPFETRPHNNVIGARRVAAPVPRTGEQAHGFQEVRSHPHAACGEGKSSVERARVPTHSVWKTRKAL